MKLILFIAAVIVAVLYVGSYLVALHFLKQAVNKMQKIQEKEKEEKK